MLVFDDDKLTILGYFGHLALYLLLNAVLLDNVNLNTFGIMFSNRKTIFNL